MDTGSFVRDLRRRRGLTQEQLALRAGTTQAAVSQLETGAVSPTVDRLEQVLLCLGVRLRFVGEPMDLWTEPAHLDEYAAMTPAERVRHGATSSRPLSALVGRASRDRQRHSTPPPLDLDRILEVLNRHGVDFVVIGGIAVLAHGNQRATLDLDLVASHTRENLRRLAAALDELNAELAGTDAHLLPADQTNPEHLANGANWTMHTDAGKVDFLSEVPGGRPYGEIRDRSVEVDGYDPSFRIVGLDDLIRMKREAGRPKDLADIAALERPSEPVDE